MATHKQLCAAVEPTPIGEILVSVEGTECEEFYRNYLHDFIRLVHKCNHKDREYEIQEYEVRKLFTFNLRLMLVRMLGLYLEQGSLKEFIKELRLSSFGDQILL